MEKIVKMFLSDVYRKRFAYVLNIILCNIGWLANVRSAAAGYPFLGPQVQIVLLLVHFSVTAPLYKLDWKQELLLILTTLAYAFFAESTLALKGVFPWQMPPPFILAMWANFASSLNVSFEFIHTAPFPWTPALLGFIFGPLSYLSGAKMGAIVMPEDKVTFFTTIALEWAVTLPILVSIAGAVSPKQHDRAPDSSFV